MQDIFAGLQRISQGIDRLRAENADLLAQRDALLEAAKGANTFLSWLASEGKCGDVDRWQTTQQKIHAAIAMTEGER